MVQPELESLVPFEREAGVREQWFDLRDLESMVLVRLHAIEDPDADHHIEQSVDGRRRDGQNELTPGAQKPSRRSRESRALARIHVLEHRQRAHSIECSRFVRRILGEVPGTQRVVAADEWPGQTRVEADPLAAPAR